MMNLNYQEYPEPKFNYEINDQEFAVAHQAKDIGDDLVHRFHYFLEEQEVRIDYVFLKKTPVTNGKEILGRAVKVTGRNAWLALADGERYEKTIPDIFFVIELSWENWRRLPIHKRVALVDHELSHCAVDENGKPISRSHDCEEFHDVVRRHGNWSNDITDLIEAAKENESKPLFSKEAIKAAGSSQN